MYAERVCARRQCGRRRRQWRRRLFRVHRLHKAKYAERLSRVAHRQRDEHYAAHNLGLGHQFAAERHVFKCAFAIIVVVAKANFGFVGSTGDFEHRGLVDERFSQGAVRVAWRSPPTASAPK